MGSGVKGCWFYEERKTMDLTKLYRMDKTEFSKTLDDLSFELLKELGRLWKADLTGCENKEEVASTIYHRRDEMYAKQRLTHRLCHYKKLLSLNAPEMLFERSRNLLARSVLETTPGDLLDAIEQFSTAYQEFDENHKQDQEAAYAQLEAEMKKKG